MLDTRVQIAVATSERRSVSKDAMDGLGLIFGIAVCVQTIGTCGDGEDIEADVSQQMDVSVYHEKRSTVFP